MKGKMKSIQQQKKGKKKKKKQQESMVTKKQNIMVEISQNINEMAQISHIFLLKDNQTGLKVNMA